MIPEAEQLYKACGRFDLLNKLYQDSGRWTAALLVAKELDRGHLRHTHFLYGRHLESLKQVPHAHPMDGLVPTPTLLACSVSSFLNASSKSLPIYEKKSRTVS